MSKSIPDNDYLNVMADNLEAIQMAMSVDIEHLRNQDADLFLRLMAYVRGTSCVQVMKLLGSIVSESMAHGFIINDPMFQTQESKKNGWGVCDVSASPFFMSEGDKSEEKKEEVLRKLIKNLLKE